MHAKKVLPSGDLYLHLDDAYSTKDTLVFVFTMPGGADRPRLVGSMWVGRSTRVVKRVATPSTNAIAVIPALNDMLGQMVIFAKCLVAAEGATLSQLLRSFVQFDAPDCFEVRIMSRPFEFRHYFDDDYGDLTEEEMDAIDEIAIQEAIEAGVG